MKNYFLIFVVLIIKLTYLNTAYADKISILYKVENSPITNKDIAKEINYLSLFNKELKNIDEEQLIKYASKSAIRYKVKKNKLLEVFKFGENDELVNRQVKVLVSDLNLNQLQFEQLLDQLGLSLTFIKKKIEIEFLWNRLIIALYKDKLNINVSEIEKKLKSDLNDPSNFIDEFLLYEIFFSPNQKTNIDNEIMKVYNSIEDIGFEKTANIMSEAQSSKLGGKIGWVTENQLSKEIFDRVKILEVGKHTGAINIVGGIIILHLKEKRKIESDLNYEDELKKIISAERDRQLTQYSSVFYKKIEINTKIYEN
ncbi:peptidylprolyl isomerase [Pelagibacterales bacterium SAG-MED15]|nr:peptidylprolyl isomerase [Pelagibacterales bacterium SAG-MED15]